MLRKSTVRVPRRSFLLTFLGRGFFLFGFGSIGFPFVYQKNESCFKVVILNRSASGDGRENFSDERSFWEAHFDLLAHQLNEEFKKTGKLLNVESKISFNGKVAVLIKTYRSYQDHLEYVERLAEIHKQVNFKSKVRSAALT